VARKHLMRVVLKEAGPVDLYGEKELSVADYSQLSQIAKTLQDGGVQFKVRLTDPNMEVWVPSVQAFVEALSLVGDPKEILTQVQSVVEGPACSGSGPQCQEMMSRLGRYRRQHRRKAAK